MFKKYRNTIINNIIIVISIFIVIIFALVGCKNNTLAEGVMNSELAFLIDGQAVEVEWEDNSSVNDIKEKVKTAPLVINTHIYGGFEQVGEIGHSIVSNNEQMKTEPGDIVLYNGNNLVVFLGSNSWSYTKLGKIKNKTTEELKNLLNKNSVVFTITSQSESK